MNQKTDDISKPSTRHDRLTHAEASSQTLSTKTHLLHPAQMHIQLVVLAGHPEQDQMNPHQRFYTTDYLSKVQKCDFVPTRLESPDKSSVSEFGKITA